MAFSKETYEKALQIKNEQRQRALREYDAALQAAEESCPQLREIKDELNKTGSQIALAAVAGDTEKLAQLKAKCEQLCATQAEIFKTTYAPPSAPVYTCPRCNDTGYVSGRLCDCVQDLAKSIWFEELSAKMPIDRCSFDNFDLSYYPDDGSGKSNPRVVATTTLQICKNFVETFPCGNNLLFSGKPGLGKTHLSLAIGAALIEKGYSVIYSPAQNIIDAILRERFLYTDSGDVITAVAACDLLILDDLGTEVSTTSAVSVVYNLINTRILENKSTIISTNLDPDEIEKRYNARVLSRIIGHYTKRTFKGDDIRQERKKRG